MPVVFVPRSPAWKAQVAALTDRGQMRYSMPSTRAGRVARQCAAARRAAIAERVALEEARWVDRLGADRWSSEEDAGGRDAGDQGTGDQGAGDLAAGDQGVGDLSAGGQGVVGELPGLPPRDLPPQDLPHPDPGLRTRRDLRAAARAAGGHHVTRARRWHRNPGRPAVPHLRHPGLPWRSATIRRPDIPEWLTLGRAVAAVVAAVVLAAGGTAAARAGALSSPPLTVPARAAAGGFSDASELPASDQVSLTSSTSAPLPGSAGAAAGVTPVERPAESWVTSVAAATGVSPVAIRAYGAAALAAATSTPTCGVGWATVAAIGEIESGHGTFGGATLLDDGRTSVPILGPALNGTGGTAAIPSTPESMRWHSDPEWEHAVGPMQVLPSTWQRWATDGDGDGTSDPTDIDDAAAMAARYLCADGATMTTPTGWHDAVFSYNHSESYVAQVAEVASGYVRATAP